MDALERPAATAPSAYPRELHPPFDAAAARGLNAGERVSLFGRIFTGRDRFHKFLHEGGPSPVDLRHGVIYHCGPVVLRDGDRWVVKAAGPTTSIREEPYMPGIIARYGLAVIIGKGGMGEATRRACAEYGCVYVHAVGGAAALIAKTVVNVAGVHMLKEFGAAEAVWEFDVEGLTGVVTIDAHGRSLHQEIADASGEALHRLMAT